jgi:DNA-directed RNA polymerase subunit RPC12/RpoP
MRLRCFDCGKSVTTELPDKTIIRAYVQCPECIEKEIIKERDDWHFFIKFIVDHVEEYHEYIDAVNDAKVIIYDEIMKERNRIFGEM